MQVEIVVSAEELKNAVECVALISGGGPKKKDVDGKNLVTALKISALSHKQDNNYILTYELYGFNEQLRYRMDGKSYKTSEPAKIFIEAKRFMELAKTFSGDVTLIFQDNKFTIIAGSSKYNISPVVAVMPEMHLPAATSGVTLGTSFLQDAVRHCSICIDRNTDINNRFTSIQLNLTSDGYAKCWSTNGHRIAKYISEKTGCDKQLTLMLLPAFIQHMVDLCDQNELCLIQGQNCIYATTPRFDYMCSVTNGSLPDCQRVFDMNKVLKTVVVPRGRLLDAVTRARIIVGDINDGKIQIGSDEANFYVSAASVAGDGTEAIPVSECTGEDNDTNYISANALSRILGGCQSENVAVSSCGKLKPYIISAPESASCFLLAPMRG